jgi:hypothetical protein
MGTILSHFAPGTALVREIRLDVIFLAACLFQETVVENLPPRIPHAFISPF